MRNDQRTVLRSVFAGQVLALHEKRRRDVVAMLELCGISPGDVPADTPIWRHGDEVHLKRFVRNEETGRIRLNENGTGPMVSEFTVTSDRIPKWIPSN